MVVVLVVGVSVRSLPCGSRGEGSLESWSLLNGSSVARPFLQCPGFGRVSFRLRIQGRVGLNRRFVDPTSSSQGD